MLIDHDENVCTHNVLPSRFIDDDDGPISGKTIGLVYFRVPDGKSKTALLKTKPLITITDYIAYILLSSHRRLKVRKPACARTVLD